MQNDKSHKIIRVIVSGFTANYGGVETFLYQHYSHMDHNKVHIDFLTHVKNPAYKNEIEKMGGRFFYIPVRNKSPFRYRQAMKAFFQQHAEEYDVFWCNKCMLNNIDFLKYATKYNIPIRILHSHNSSNMDTGIKGRVMELMHKHNKRRIKSYVTEYWVCSDYAAKWLLPTDVYEKRQYTFIPNAVSAEKFRTNAKVREQMRKQLGVEEKYVIGHVGRFNYQKNHEFLIRIFQIVYEKNPNSELILVGTGELEDTVKQQVRELGLEKAVHFLGVRHDIPELMQAMDCFVLPSRFEGLPVVAVEAQAAGLPCVLASDGITEQVKIIDNVSFLKLDQSVDEWAKEIMEKELKRVDSYLVLKEKGFNMEEAANKMSERLVVMKNKLL